VNSKYTKTPHMI